MIYSSFDPDCTVNGVFNDTTITGYLVKEMPVEYCPKAMAEVLSVLLNDVYEQAVKDARKLVIGKDLV